MAAGERALGPEVFETEAGHFWGVTETRPYMRARFGLARCLEDLERTDEAIGHSGSMEEAVITVDELGRAWQATPGAAQWLRAEKPKGRPRARKR